MAAVPSSHTFVDGVAVTSEMNTYVRDPIAFLLARPICRARSNTTQSLTTGTWTSLNLQVEDIDTDVSGTGGHDNSTNNSRFTALYAGWYLASGGVVCASASTQRVGVRFAVNGTNINCSRTFMNEGSFSNSAFPAASTLVYLNVGDYVEVQGYQESGGAINFGSATVDNNNILNLVWESN